MSIDPTEGHSPVLDRYLAQSYRRDVMGERVVVDMPVPSDELLAEIEKEITRIDALHLGASLANRDFVAYQNRRALLRLRMQLKTAQQEEQQET